MSDITDRMQETARIVKTVLPPNSGFFLLAFDFDDAGRFGRADYVSNCNREDVVEIMKQFIQKTENGGWMKDLDKPPEPPR